MSKYREMTTECVFCKIVKKERESFIVLENDDFLAFLDQRPLFAGHTLLIPKLHVPCFDDLPKNLMANFLFYAQCLSHALQTGLHCHGTFIAMNNKVSQSVAHLHMHIVPRNFKDGLKGFFWPRQQYQGSEEMSVVQQKIIAHLSV